MRLALAQINPVVGDLEGNRRLILGRLAEAKANAADLVLFPELAVTGYPPEDLLLRPGFVRAAESCVEAIAREARGTTVLLGAPHFDRDLFNACYVLSGGEVKAVYRKRFLPNYGVFDEDRYFAPGRDLILLEHGTTLVGPTVCEDMWQPGPPATDLALAGAELLVNISASPFYVGRDREREEIPPVEIIHVGTRGPSSNGSKATGEVAPFVDELEQMRLALELGLHDYVGKNGFSDVVVGVSGGIDSAVTAALAAETLGPAHVHCVSMPSRYSSEATRGDARRLAESLGCSFRELPIGAIVDAFDSALSDAFAGTQPDLAEENIEARARGVLLMALSNKFGWMLVATGNKSELSVGYATLYGDMAGGFALLKDVYKTDVFRLARYLNERAEQELIPRSIIDRAPSAELRDNQLDEDSLPPYPKLDEVLEQYVEHDRSLEELSSDGFDQDVVERAVAMIDRAEYKRRQAPPGVKLRPKAFGRDRRTPITNHWRG